LTAFYLEMDRSTLQGGLYAYNGVLIGTGLVDYFSFDFKVAGLTDGWPVVIFLSVLLGPVTLIAGLFIQYKLLGGGTTPMLLLPFNVVMFVVLLSAKLWDSTMVTQVELAEEGVLADLGATEATRYFGYQALFNGLSRIFLVDGIATGVLILIGTFTCSRILCLGLVAGSFLASVISLAVFDEHTAYLNAGFAGYNPALTVAGIFYFVVPSWKLTGVAFFWILVTMIAQAAVGVLLDAL
jgi:urea transporter